MSGGFKRSGRFGLIGVVVVAALVAVIATTTGQGEANPKLTLGLIFGVIAIFVVVLIVLQRADIERAAGADAASTARGAAEGGRQVADPTTMSEPELWAALAVSPIDADAVRARGELWDVNRRSHRLGAIVFALILLTVPAIYLTESFVPLLIGGPLILAAAIYGSYRAISPGGEIESGYERTSRAMRPLGLAVTEKPKGGFEARYPTQPGFDYRLRGWTVLSGPRHGRAVEVRLGGFEDAGASEVRVAAPGPAFEARAHDGRLRASDGAAAAVAATLEAVPRSQRWQRLEVRGGPDGILVTRRKGEARDWLCDLWLAERLAQRGREATV
ncbi:MAG TPA: hypothetical protein VHI77_10250 [Solirubrobacterales bacterium]|nr:hypothetical protein [Solirubrobacterales bacterium]